MRCRRTDLLIWLCACGRLLSWGDGHTLYDAPVRSPQAQERLAALVHRQSDFGDASAGAPAADGVPPNAALLRRGDTESKIMYTTRRVAYAEVAARGTAFPSFPPSKMHVAQSFLKVETQHVPSATPSVSDSNSHEDEEEYETGPAARRKQVVILSDEELSHNSDSSDEQIIDVEVAVDEAEAMMRL